jgi:hypothetical protein
VGSMRLRLIFSVGVRHPLLMDHGSRGSCRHRENVRVALACGEKEPVSELPRRLNAALGKACNSRRRSLRLIMGSRKKRNPARVAGLPSARQR